MKRTIALLIAAFLLFSGCAKALPDVEPEQILPIETEQPIQVKPPIAPATPEEEPPELMNSEERCAEILNFLNEICDVADKSERRLLYAQYSLPDDWMIGADVPLELYQYPYNIDSIQPYNAYGDFMSNTEVLNAYKAEIIDDLIALARAVGEFHANANGDSFEKDPYTQSAVASICPELLLEDIRTFKEYDLTNSFITEGKFLSDQSLVYQAVDGTLRVRGRLYMRPISGSTKAINDLTPGEWYYADMEFIALPTEIVCEWLGFAPWTQNGLTITGYFYLHQYWIQASDEEFAWIETDEKALAENRPIE